MDEGFQIAREARERALAHLAETEEKEAEEEDFSFPESRKVAEGRGGGGDGGGGDDDVGIEERMLDMLTPLRGQGVGKMILHWAGKDARKNLSLEDDDEPFDLSVPPWHGRLTPIDVPEGGFERKEGDVRGLGREEDAEDAEDAEDEEDEEGKGGSAPPPLRPPVGETPPHPEGAVADDQPAESPSKSRPVKKRRRGRPRKKSVAPT